jgi:hypothetical protein
MEAAHMKVLRTAGAVTLFLLFGIAVPALAQGDRQDEGAKPAQHEEQAKPAKQERQAKPAKEEKQAKPARQEQSKTDNWQQTKTPKPEMQNWPAQHERQAEPVKQPRDAKPEQRQDQAKATSSEDIQQAGSREPRRSAADEQRQRSQPELRLSARGEDRIPDDRFRAHFGRGHEFRIDNPRLVGGYSRFQYGGYWFGFVDPWPVNWYYTDDVYVDYINGGYYLCNPSYPGAQVAISVVL